MALNNLSPILDNLYLGNANAIYNSQIPNLSLTVNCTVDLSCNPQVETIRLPVDDDPSMVDLYLQYIESTDVLEKMHKHITHGKPVLVHCMAGAQRSPALVALYLMKYHGFTPDGAIDYIRIKRPIAFFSHVNFYEMLYKFYNKLKTIE